ncbi:hypothetical protein DVH24_023111 [Malus domestica]|uniref:LysM domain-containing protein n=1 Tax=Malus domestica TaxID=3750 RepID=A0A498KN52_MALDO|nr:hypothetical protein DVH24_023111 [Malus domestica]
MKREQAAVYLVFALLMLRAQDADAELGKSSTGLDLETSPARQSLVATRFMLATWVSPGTAASLFLSFKFCSAKCDRCSFSDERTFFSNPESWSNLKLFTNIRQGQTLSEIRNRHPDTVEMLAEHAGEL